MIRLSMASLTALLTLTIALAGCGGGSGSGSGLPTTQIQTLIYRNGVSTTWTNASLSGSGLQYGCTYGNDNLCYTSFGPSSTGSSGTYTLSTDAIPGYWDFTAPADAECSQYTDSGAVSVSPSEAVPFVCGQPASDVTANPNSCEQRYTNGGQVLAYNGCPSTTTLTVKNRTLPTGRSLSVQAYTTNGTALSGASVAATNATSISVAPPIPHTPSNGTTTNMILVRDPTNSNVLIATAFQVKQYVSGVDK